MSPSLTRVGLISNHSSVCRSVSSKLLTASLGLQPSSAEPGWASWLALQVELSGEAMSFLCPVRPSSSPEGGGHILLQPCPLPWLLPLPLCCLLSLESESEVRDPFQGSITSPQWQHTCTSKASSFSRALDDRALMTLGNIVSTDIIGGACAHRRVGQ